MMYNIDKLTLISGIDIPIPELQVNIHQPTIREIAYIGEKDFYTSAQAITMSVDKFTDLNKDNLTEEGKVALSRMSNFQLLMTMINEDQMMKIHTITLLTLLFPKYMIEVEEDTIMLMNSDNIRQSLRLDDNSFSVLQQVVETILCLHSGDLKEDFNPIGEQARAIAEKIKKGREKVARLNGEADKQKSFLSRYISGLGIGTKTLNIHNVLDLTLYQLFDQMERFGLHESYNIAIKAKIAGAKDVEDIDWLKDIENN